MVLEQLGGKPPQPIPIHVALAVAAGPDQPGFPTRWGAFREALLTPSTEHRTNLRILLPRSHAASASCSFCGNARQQRCLLRRALSQPGIADDAVQIIVNPQVQRLSIIFPLSKGRFRAYVVVRHGSRPPLSGTKDFDAFVECCGLGPEAPSDETAQGRLFGED